MPTISAAASGESNIFDPFEPHPLPNRIGIRPEPCRRRFVDHDDGTLPGAVAVGQRASAQDGNAQRFEVSGCHVVPQHRGRVRRVRPALPEICSVAFAHCVESGAQPSTVTARTPGTRSICSSTRSIDAGADAVSYITSDGRIVNVSRWLGSKPSAPDVAARSLSAAGRVGR